MEEDYGWEKGVGDKVGSGNEHTMEGNGNNIDGIEHGHVGVENPIDGVEIIAENEELSMKPRPVGRKNTDAKKKYFFDQRNVVCVEGTKGLQDHNLERIKDAGVS